MRFDPSRRWGQVACVLSLTLQGLGRLGPGCCSHHLMPSTMQLGPLDMKAPHMPKPKTRLL